MTKDFHAAVELMQTLRARGLSYDAIAAVLMSRGYKTKWGKTCWNVGTVYKALNKKEPSPCQ